MEKDIKEKLIEAFEKSREKADGKFLSGLGRIRSLAMEVFNREGFPTVRNENWKYTNVSFLNRIEFAIPEGSPEVERELIDSLEFDTFSAYRIVLLNGEYRKEFSEISDDTGLRIMPLEEAMNSDFNILNKNYGKVADFSDNAFTAINTALAATGVFICAGKNFILDKPLHLMIINDARELPAFTQSRIFIHAESGSDFKIITTTHNLGENNGLINIVAEIVAEANSRFEHYLLQDAGDNAYTFSDIRVNVAQDSNFKNYTFNFSGKFTRNYLGSLLDGSNIEAHYLGVFIGRDNEFIDNHTFADHAGPNSFSNENYKGILDDKSVGVFNGKILVRKEAQKTNAYQSNKNVLLSNGATINTKPELEIYADDVKCSHGATSGALDTEPLFYLRSRGIDENLANVMLLNAFADEVILQVNIPELKDYLLQRAEEKLEKEY